MKKAMMAVLSLALATALTAQQTTAPAAQTDGDKIVATLNGEVITRAELDFLYDRMGAQMKTQYEDTGGKTAFLENYLRKRLVIQEALKSGFDQQPQVKAEMQAARESALFDLYVREIVSKDVVTEAMLRKFYEENRDQFVMPARAKVRHIVITANDGGSRPRSKEEARALITALAEQLEPLAPAAGSPRNKVEAFRIRFAAAAREHSEDAAGPDGGDLGWVGQSGLDPAFAAAAFALPAGTMSGVVESTFGYHLIFVEAKEEAGHEPYEKARSAVRELVMRQKAADVMGQLNRLATQLRQSSTVTINKENLD